MAIVGGLDIHRKQITFDCLDTETGELQRGRICPADRRHLAAWLARWLPDQRGEGGVEVELAVEGCTGWRYVVEELDRAGVRPHLAEPADTAGLRGRRRHAKTDRADAQHLRLLLTDGRLPECWIPPRHIVEARALLETYRDVRVEHTAWVQRIHAVLFHHGAQLSGEFGSARGRAELAVIAATQLTPTGQRQIGVAVAMLAATEVQLEGLRRDLVTMARRLRGARVLTERLYGVGPITGLALTCWLGGAGRFSSARKAVRFAGLDVTVYSSDGKRSPGHLSRQGPGVLRWCLYEAGHTSARPGAPDHAYYAQVHDRIDGKRAALSQARKLVRQACHILTELGDDALTIT
ncbi:MAG TPA: IS110 family transposase [Candidatus Limnocylindrales bacterium]